MKKNVSSLTTSTRRFNINPAFGTPDISKVSPKSSSCKTTYFLRNTKATATSRQDIVNKTHSPRQVSTSSNKASTPTTGTITLQLQSNIKTSRTVQSPPAQKSPSYYLIKGKNSDTNPDFKENSYQQRTSYFGSTLDDAVEFQQQGKPVHTRSENNPNSLNTCYNFDKRQSTTPQNKNHNRNSQPQAITTSGFNTTTISLKSQNQNFPVEAHSNNKTAEELKMDNVYKNKEERSLSKAENKRILGELDLNSLEGKIISDPYHLHKNTIIQSQNWPLSTINNTQNNTIDLGDSSEIQLTKSDLNIEIHHSRESRTSNCFTSRQNTLENSPKNKKQCVRHPEKKGKYYLKSEENSTKVDLYCSKCAVDLALKGTKVSEIRDSADSFSSSSQQTSSLESDRSSGVYSRATIKPSHSQANLEIIEPEEEHQENPSNSTNDTQNNCETSRSVTEHKRRGEELQLFIKRVEELVGRMKNLESVVSYERTKAANIFLSEKSNLEGFCKRFVSAVVEKRDAIYRSLDAEQSKSDQFFNEIVKTPLRYSVEMSQIQGDVEENMENIMKNIEDKPYKKIMQKYEERLSIYENYLKERELVLMKDVIYPTNCDGVNEFKKQLRDFVNKFLDICQAPQGQSKGNISNIGDFETFLRSEEETLDLTSGQSKSDTNSVHSGSMTQNYTLISFENKDIFQNAMTTSKEGEYESSTCETIIEHEEENIDGLGAPSDDSTLADKKNPYQFKTNITTPSAASGSQGTARKTSTNRKSGRYEDISKKENFEIFVGLSTKQLNQPHCEAFVNFLESKINEESSSPKASYQKSLFTSPAFKDMEE